MPWGPAETAGFVLAALVADDRELRAVAGHVCTEWLERARERIATIPREPREAKARALRELALEVRPHVIATEGLPPRARALVARLMPKEQGRALVGDAPLARPGFDPEPDLLPCLQRLSRAARKETP